MVEIKRKLEGGAIANAADDDDDDVEIDL